MEVVAQVAAIVRGVAPEGSINPGAAHRLLRLSIHQPREEDEP